MYDIKPACGVKTVECFILGGTSRKNVSFTNSLQSHILVSELPAYMYVTVNLCGFLVHENIMYGRTP